jgi:hypothetical protein
MPLGLGFTGAGPGSDRAKIRYGFRLRILPERQILRIFVVSAHNLIQYHFPQAMVSGSNGRPEGI